MGIIAYSALFNCMFHCMGKYKLHVVCLLCALISACVHIILVSGLYVYLWDIFMASYLFFIHVFVHICIFMYCVPIFGHTCT